MLDSERKKNLDTVQNLAVPRAILMTIVKTVTNKRFRNALDRISYKQQCVWQDAEGAVSVAED